ncbi:TIGR03617 family F420-dependent LLM class oxidoreductase [Halieaceae bacterium IMCC14734]|uniref:TIGR03617 family F420-dependent LLM class oxidoreductase n=1 Tax=Candidatus Litorirhabdus singularis TaxID=2518993 RepID=A0ABT3THC9_9GAMM|nr:TIGR03617 family F420-dependent LLM class oxidoreductase [Candidatus Litorirhabdus singularis]MCX2981712.1 TIGR03617 family F420-dependent LLM class oxidoreductase [Candidatus Litorirhabdus singularis]
MQIDGPFYAQLGDAAREAAQLRDIGYDGIYTLEGAGDPFLPLAIASEHAPELKIATGIAVAFPRNPSHIAYQAWDLQRFSQGRFMLGIGSQVRAHIEKRFGIDFDPPASRMREYIEAVKAFFDCWQNGERLDYRGKYYRHTLMTPMFNPGPLEWGAPPILLGAMGPGMTAVAGEVADGLIVHPFNTMPFLLEQQLPALQRGWEKAGRTGDGYITQVAGIVVTGSTEEEYEAARRTVCGLLAFYGSTPAYLAPMAAIGYEALHPELNTLSKQGRWDEMTDLIDDDMLKAFAVCGEPASIAGQLQDKYAEFTTRLSIYAPYALPPETWKGILTELKAGGAA